MDSSHNSLVIPDKGSDCIHRIELVPSLSKSCINLKLFRDDIRYEFEKIFTIAGGLYINNKSLVFDVDILSSINLLVEASQFRSWGITSFHYSNELILNTSNEHIIYIIRSHCAICNQILRHIIMSKNKYHYVIFVSNMNTLCTKLFEKEITRLNISLLLLPITVIPIDNDILSMEYDNFIKDVVIDENLLPLSMVTKSLIDLQTKYGVIPCIQGIGEQSQFIIEEMLNLMKDNEEINIVPHIGRMIIIDRNCDYVTPLLTPLIYSGLLDDNMGINSNIIKTQHDNKDLLFKVNMDDNVYDVLKDKRIDKVNKLLNEKLLAYSIERDNIDKNTDLKQISNSMNNIKILNNEYSLNSLKIHSKITQNIIEKFNNQDNSEILELEQTLLNNSKKSNILKFLLDMINSKKYTLERIIRIICLYCIVNDGIDNDIYNILNKQILEHFGNGNKHYHYLFENLLKCGIIYPKNIKYQGYWKANKKALHLLEDYDTESPKDISYIFGGYAPISCRIVEYALSTGLNTLIQQKTKNKLFRGWKNNDVNNKLLKIGTNFHVTQDYDINRLSSEQYINMKSTVLIYFVGGITYSEIAALRFLTKMNSNKHIVIATTKIINGNNFIKTLI